MSNLTQRLITGTIFVIVLVGCIWWSATSLWALCVGIATVGLGEFYRLAEKKSAQPMKVYGVITGGIVVTLSYFARIDTPLYLVIIPPMIALIFFIELYRKKPDPFGNIAWTLSGIIYISLPLALLIYTFVPVPTESDLLRASWEDAYEPQPVISLFILIWVSDSMAYVCGRLFGKHKLWERISPKKTWEGFIGGLLFCVATGAVLGYCWLSEKNVQTAIMWGIIALVISITGMLGDLVESLFKRSIDVKDSGTILPGHGGILDRFDALFLAIPFALTVYWIYPV